MYPKRLAARWVRPTCGPRGPRHSDALEGTLLARERTLAELTARLAQIAAELNDDEVLRLLHSILDGRARARGDGSAPRS